MNPSRNQSSSHHSSRKQQPFQSRRVQQALRQTVLVLCSALTFLATPADAAEPVAGQAGIKRWSFDYQQTKVPVMLWYPATGEEISVAAGPFELQTVPEATLNDKQRGLIVISHGTGGSNIAHHPIAAALARAGFLVAALTHPGDNYQDRSLVAGPLYFDERPRQLKALLRALLTDKALGNRIDPRRIGAIGHSAGGYTVAATLGARPDRSALIQHCQQTTDDPACNYRDPTLGVSSPATSKFVPSPEVNKDDEHPVPPEPKIRSAVLLAPLGSVLDTNYPLDAGASIQIIAAEHDRILPHRYHLARLRTVAPHANVRTAQGVGHFTFIAPILPGWQQQLGEVAIDPPGADRARFVDEISRDIVTWFRNELGSN